MFVLKKMLLVVLSLTIFACTPKKETIGQTVLSSEVVLADVSSVNCLNIEKLSHILQSPNFSVPAALITTNLKSVDDMSSAKLNYFSYATFYYKAALMNELGLFTEVRQKDCKTLQIFSASEEVMTFDVVASSATEITIRLKNKFRDDMNVTQKTALFERQQPFEITYKYIDTHHLMITEKYTTVDPICATKNLLTFEIHKDLQWASFQEDLPQAYDIDPQYLNHVKDAMPAEVLSILPALENPQSVSIEAMSKVMHSPIKEELKLCTF